MQEIALWPSTNLLNLGAQQAEGLQSQPRASKVRPEFPQIFASFFPHLFTFFLEIGRKSEIGIRSQNEEMPDVRKKGKMVGKRRKVGWL